MGAIILLASIQLSDQDVHNIAHIGIPTSVRAELEGVHYGGWLNRRIGRAMLLEEITQLTEVVPALACRVCGRDSKPCTHNMARVGKARNTHLAS